MAIFTKANGKIIKLKAMNDKYIDFDGAVYIGQWVEINKKGMRKNHGPMGLFQLDNITNLFS